MNKQDTCPYCGAERQEDGILKYYECWSRPDDLSDRDANCYERQIEQLKQAILNEREACAKVCESHICTSDCSAYGLGSNCEFVISAEIRARGEVK